MYYPYAFQISWSNLSFQHVNSIVASISEKKEKGKEQKKKKKLSLAVYLFTPLLAASIFLQLFLGLPTFSHGFCLPYLRCSNHWWKNAGSEKVDLIVNVVERVPGGFSAGGGISSG